MPIPPLPASLSLTNVDPTDQAQQFGIKLDHSGSGVDWSFSYSHSIDRTPRILNASPQSTQVGLQYPMVNVFGADAAIPIGNYGFRGEVAYTHTPNHAGSDPLAQNDGLFAVLGVERTFWGELNINSEYLYKKTFDFHDPSTISDPNVQALAQEEQTIGNQVTSDAHGLAFRINYKALHETLESEIAVVAWSQKKDSFVQPKVSYAFTDRIKGIIGAHLWSGPRNSPLGQLRDVTAGFGELRYGF